MCLFAVCGLRLETCVCVCVFEGAQSRQNAQTTMFVTLFLFFGELQMANVTFVYVFPRPVFSENTCFLHVSETRKAVKRRRAQAQMTHIEYIYIYGDRERDIDTVKALRPVPPIQSTSRSW